MSDPAVVSQAVPDLTSPRHVRFQEAGIVKLEGLLGAELLSQCRKAFDWSVKNPGPLAHFSFEESKHQHWVDNLNPAAVELYRDLVRAPRFAEAVGELLGSRHIWYFGEEIFMRRGGMSGRTPWHQDTAYQPWGGDQWVNLWISFESLPIANALEVVCGSHRGPQYDGSSYRDAEYPTEPLHGGKWPRLPNVEFERRRNPDAWTIASFATEPGDVIALHPRCLHGGAPVDRDTPNRSTLVLRFFGDDAHFQPLDIDSGYQFLGEEIYDLAFGDLQAGDPLRSPIFEQIR